MSDLSGLKVGDEVIVKVSGGIGPRGNFVETVSGISPSGRIKTSGGREFNADGSIRPKPYRGFGRILAATPENLQPARVAELQRSISQDIRNNSFYRWPLAKLERVWAAINAEELRS